MHDDQYYNDGRQLNLPGYLFGQFFGPPQQTPPFYGQPGGFPWWPGSGYPGSPGSPGQQQSGPPSTPPPNFTPEHQAFQTFAVDPGAIRRCLFQFTYVWLRRDAFWFYPVFVGQNSISGYRWRRNRWVYFGIELNQIQSFQCF